MADSPRLECVLVKIPFWTSWATVYAIVDMPDPVSAAAMALAVNASGVVKVRTTVLLTPEEMDQASKKSVTYTPPGRV